MTEVKQIFLKEFFFLLDKHAFGLNLMLPLDRLLLITSTWLHVFAFGVLVL